MKMVRRYTTAAGLLIGGLVIGLVLLVLAGQTAPVQVTDQPGAATIVFEADPGRVLLPGECVTLRWQAEGIQAIYLNEAGVVGAGSQQFCQTGDTAPMLRVVLPDGEQQTYSLAIDVLFTNPLIIALLLFAGAGITGGVLSLVGSLLGTHPARLLRQSASVLLPVAVGIVVSLLLLEIGLRVYFDTAGTQEQRIMYRYSVEEIRDLQSNIIHTPYVSYVLDPDYEGHNALGFRGDEITLPKPDDTFRIVALGGSTTYSTGTDAANAYPARLGAILRDDYNYDRVEVINGGVMGYTSWEQVAHFAFRVLELEPDMIILYLGVNDLVVREQSQTDCYAGQNPLRGLNPHRGLFVDRQAPYPASTLQRMVGILLGWLPNPLALDSSFEPVQVDCNDDPPATTLEQRLATNTPHYFRRNLFNIIALARANGIQPVLSSWAYYIDADRPDLWRQGIAEQNDILRDLAASEDVPFYDLAANFPVDSRFWERDGIHMLPPGTTEQAQQYAAFLHGAGLLPQSASQSDG